MIRAVNVCPGLWFGNGPSIGRRFVLLVRALHSGYGEGSERSHMDFAIILIVSNTVLAAFIYFVVTRIWQD